MVRRRSLLSVALLLVVFGAIGCSENPVGRKCFIGDDPDNPAQAVITSPALECPSRTCLHMPGQGSEDPDLCTAECESEEDCDKVPESPCVTGFACAIPVVVGPFCCRKMCICKDYLVIPDGGVPVPAACEDTPENREACVNI